MNVTAIMFGGPHDGEEHTFDALMPYVCLADSPPVEAPGPIRDGGFPIVDTIPAVSYYVLRRAFRSWGPTTLAAYDHKPSPL